MNVLGPVETAPTVVGFMKSGNRKMYNVDLGFTTMWMEGGFVKAMGVKIPSAAALAKLGSN